MRQVTGHISMRRPYREGLSRGAVHLPGTAPYGRHLLGRAQLPWGVSRYGFDPFVAQYPGNTVAAIGAYWISCNQAILEFHDKNTDRCAIVRGLGQKILSQWPLWRASPSGWSPNHRPEITRRSAWSSRTATARAPATSLNGGNRAAPMIASPATWMSLLESNANVRTRSSRADSGASIRTTRTGYVPARCTLSVRSWGWPPCPCNHSDLGDFLIGAEQARFDQAEAARWRSSRAFRYSATTRSVSSWADVSLLSLSRVIRPPWSRFTRSHTSSTWP